MRETQKKKKKTGARNNETKVRTQNKTTQQHNPPKNIKNRLLRCPNSDMLTLGKLKNVMRPTHHVTLLTLPSLPHNKCT